MDAVCLGTASGRLPRPGHRYMQLDALRACIMDVHYGMVMGSDSGRSLSVLSVELRLIVVVVVYTWSATVMSAALQNLTVIKLRGVQQKLMNISKVDGQRSAVVRGVVQVVKRLSRRHSSTDCRTLLSVTTSSKCRNRRVLCRATVVAA